MTASPSILFYTCVNEKFWAFGLLYPIFVLNSNPGAKVEVGVENHLRFTHKFKHIISFYEKEYPGRVRFSAVSFTQKRLFGSRKIVPNSVRFVTQPKLKADYVYIGDADILITEEVASQHLANIEKHHLDFSNVVRPNKNRLTGLHFIAYDKMYPLPSLHGIDLSKCNDETVLTKIIQRKGLKMPGPEAAFRPIHGLHISLYSSTPFETMTTKDKIVDFPCWFPSLQSNHNLSRIDCVKEINKYYQIRYSEPVKKFFSVLKPKNTEIRRIIQITDACAYYYLNVVSRPAG